MLAQFKKDKLTTLQKQVRTLQIKKSFLMEECKQAKEKLDELKKKVNKWLHLTTIESHIILLSFIRVPMLAPQVSASWLALGLTSGSWGPELFCLVLPCRGQREGPDGSISSCLLSFGWRGWRGKELWQILSWTRWWLPFQENVSWSVYCLFQEGEVSCCQFAIQLVQTWRNYYLLIALYIKWIGRIISLDRLLNQELENLSLKSPHRN